MTVRVVVAPNALKGSVSAREASSAIELGVLDAAPDASIVSMPIADGGDGTADVLENALRGVRHRANVTDPLGRPIAAHFVSIDRGATAIVELATASGLLRIAEAERNPLLTTTFGTGQLLCAAIESGATKLILGVGGSATVDGGCGILQALGARLYARDGSLLGSRGGVLKQLARIDTSQLIRTLSNIDVEIACDVETPLTGPNGAARVFAPQKGADARMTRELELGLEQLARVLERDFGKHGIGSMARGGAAGGVSATLFAVLGAKLEAGIDLVLDLLNFDEQVKSADLVITSEGQADAQTLQNKGPLGVLRRAARYGVPTTLIAGAFADGFSARDTGFAGAFSLCSENVSRTQAIADAPRLLRETSREVVRQFIARRL